MILISAPPAENMILSAHTESVILSVGSAKKQSTKSCSRNCGNNGGSSGDSGGGNRFDVGSSKDNCSYNSNGNGDGDGDSGDSDSRNNNSNSDSGGGDSDSSGSNNNQLKAALEKVATVVHAVLASILLAS
jgi:hypothetical protein